MITFKCDKCGRQYKVSDGYAGKDVICKGCQIMITVPSEHGREEISFDSSFDTGEIFMSKNYDVFQALLKHEREAPAVNI